MWWEDGKAEPLGTWGAETAGIEQAGRKIRLWKHMGLQGRSVVHCSACIWDIAGLVLLNKGLNFGSWWVGGSVQLAESHQQQAGRLARLFC